MATQDLLQQATEILKPWVRWTKASQQNQLTVSISRGDLLSAIQALLDSHWGYLSAITGLHIPNTGTQTNEEKQWSRTTSEFVVQPTSQPEGDSFLVLYHFCNRDAIVTLRVHPPSLKDNQIPSVCGLIPSATLYERELVEMFGIDVVGTPDTGRFVLPEDWPEGVYPLRKDFTGFEEKIH